jgi:hypothetical protein
MLYVAKETFTANLDGVPYTFYEGRTLVDDSDEVYKRFAGNFEVARSRFAAPEVESATASPGERRGEKVKA